MKYEAYMMKKGDRGLVKRWKKRWMQLDESSRCMIYSETPASAELGRIELSKATRAEESMSDGSGWAFEICVGTRIYELTIENEEQRRLWLLKIRSVMNNEQEHEREHEKDRHSEVLSSSTDASLSSGGGEAYLLREQLADEKRRVVELQEALRLARLEASSSSSGGLESSAEMAMQLEKKEREIHELKSEMRELIGINERADAQTEALKFAYFRASAIGVSMQLQLNASSLPPMNALYARAQTHEKDWEHWVDYLKRELPKLAKQ
jgi:PH domain